MNRAPRIPLYPAERAGKYCLYSSGVLTRRKVAWACAARVPEESKTLRSMALSARPSRLQAFSPVLTV